MQPLFEITNIILAFDVVLVFFHIIIIISSLTIASYCKIKPTKDGWLLIYIMSPLFPLSNLSIHFTHIVIGFIHNEKHATSVGPVFHPDILARGGKIEF